MSISGITPAGFRAKVYVRSAVCRGSASRDDFGLLSDHLAVFAARSLAVVHSALAVEAKAGEPAPV
jgi:hypothetical protein